MWNDANIRHLRELAKKGLSAKEIGEKLTPLKSRNAVIGKMHRLGLSAIIPESSPKMVSTKGTGAGARVVQSAKSTKGIQAKADLQKLAVGSKVNTQLKTVNQLKVVGPIKASGKISIIAKTSVVGKNRVVGKTVVQATPVQDRLKNAKPASIKTVAMSGAVSLKAPSRNVANAPALKTTVHRPSDNKTPLVKETTQSNPLSFAPASSRVGSIEVEKISSTVRPVRKPSATFNAPNFHKIAARPLPNTSSRMLSDPVAQGAGGGNDAGVAGSATASSGTKMSSKMPTEAGGGDGKAAFFKMPSEPKPSAAAAASSVKMANPTAARESLTTLDSEPQLSPHLQDASSQQNSAPQNNGQEKSFLGKMLRGAGKALQVIGLGNTGANNTQDTSSGDIQANALSATRESHEHMDFEINHDETDINSQDEEESKSNLLAFRLDRTRPIIRLVDLTPTMCKWPEGGPDEETFTFCGDDKPYNLPYCSKHHVRAYQNGASRRPADAVASHAKVKKPSKIA